MIKRNVVYDPDKSTGGPHGKRHIVTNKEFKPLKDLLKLSGCPITQQFYEDVFVRHHVEQFVMSPQMSLEVEKLKTQLFAKKEDLLRLLPMAIPPYPRVCVEMPITDEIGKLRGGVLTEGTHNIYRVGAYIETVKITEDKYGFSFSPYYEFETGFVSTSHILLAYYDNQEMPNCIPVQFPEIDITWNALFVPAFRKIQENGMSEKQLMETLEGSRDMFRSMVKEAAEELPNLFIAWLVLLNSKSGVTKTKVREIYPNPKLGKRERNRRSRSAYTVVSLTDTENVNADSGVVTEKHIVSAHRVRGHFKAKKWGVFWWRPHVRGVGELKDREAYKLTA